MGAWVMDGSLTIRSVTKEVPLTFRFKGMFPDMPAGQPARASFHATTAVKRGDFGMTRDNLMELGPNPTDRTWRSRLTWRRTPVHRRSDGTRFE